MEIVNLAEENPIRFQISHETTYRYSGQVSFMPHRLVLRPRESHFERIETMQLTTNLNSVIHWYQDIYGNIIARAEFPDPGDELIIRSEFTILKRPYPNWAENDAALLGEEYPAYYPGIEEAASHLYRQSVYPHQVEAVRAWVRSLGILPVGGDRAPIFARLARHINEQVSYTRREEPGVQSPTRTLDLKTGSCRDTAVLMMEAGRCIGYATRFVSGYLESSASRVGRGSTHAWTEVYLPDRGWVGFDPSIGEPIGVGHIAVAVSHHPRGVMPVSGKFQGHGNSPLGMTISIQSIRL
ncbi:MAG: transglutaminase family protein [Verrucomicrobiales bacterium]|nr:transglutaminase family protein [Verrucomicrobiales bacterium]